ncbi:hypothetical protein [Pseudomonas protegens]|uniref:hypothetical protein n=1 Tax=Pseudomonas protegens TaxID=380021 RepID=UPI00277A258D|nr:hypothetical protein [Pseudomonas protegens]MDP9518557.1 hypothetical protein [Pseudomonas protegens]
MLQIISGKLFEGEPGQENILRGVLYTSANWFGDEPLVTAAGTITPLSYLRGNRAVYFEAVEKIEYKPGAGVIASYTIEQVITEFSAIASFALNIICTPNVNLLERLLDESPSVGVPMLPGKHVERIFDKKINIVKSDGEFLQEFIQKLIDLPRDKFRAAVRAIQNYVTAVHRLSDNLELSYTLFVASIESLAQKFDGHIAEWSDYEHGKRGQIDKALEGADDDVKAKVRAAILKIEHTAASRRFIDFSIEHLPHDFFSSVDELSPLPIGKIDLPEALRNAYSIRSKYIHELLALPEDLKFRESGAQMVEIDSRTLLTFQGLSRLARSVIIEFIKRQEVIKLEPYNYLHEIPGVRMGRLSPELWITRPEHVSISAGADFLNGYLLLFRKLYISGCKEKLLDISDSLAAALKLYPNMSDIQKRPYAILHRIWNLVCNQDTHKVQPELEDNPKYIKLTEEPSIESLLAHAVTGNDTEWSEPDHTRIFNSYFKKRETGKVIRLPRDLEACVCLAYAERLRTLDLQEKAKQQVSLTADSFLNFPAIRTFERSYDGTSKIKWLGILFPAIKSDQ